MKFVVFKDKKREWRWRLVAKNGQVVATSGEGYKRRTGVMKIIARIQQKVSLAQVE